MFSTIAKGLKETGLRGLTCYEVTDRNRGMAEVEVDAALAERHVSLGMSEYLHESEEGSKARLMVGTGDALFKFIEAGGAPAFLDHTSCHWHLDAKKLVAFAILSFAALEEARQTCHLA